MKTQNLFDWPAIIETYGLRQIPEALLENSFILDTEKQMVYLSSALFDNICPGHLEDRQAFSVKEFLDFLAETSRYSVLEDINRLSQEKLYRTDVQAVVKISEEYIPALFIMAKIPDKSVILGIVHLSYELMHEYQHHLDSIITKLEETQNINQLILEGSTDYIYHLDLVNNICTFSPKALDVLPLETATFGNAMDRILSFIHPEDRHIFLDSFTPFLTGKTEYHTAEYRVYTKQGNIMWISCHGKGLHDSQGRPVMIAGSLMDITDTKKAEERINHMLYTDMLTGMRNRYCYEQEMGEYMSRPDASGCIIAIDIHNFKLYNEIFGHNFGNLVLKEFASMLQIYLPRNLGIYRLEGDEFLVHMEDSDKASILESLTPLQITLSKARIIDGHSIYIDVTIGIVIYPDHGATPDELLKNADTVLYKMSKYSSEKVMFFINDNGNDLSKRYQLENELRADIENHFRHFRVVYQPIVHLMSNGASWCSAEALLRYQNPGLPDVTQQELIETLEVSDLIIPVGRWVLSKAIEECSLWNRTGAIAGVHVNFSAQQMSDAGIMEYIKQLLKKHNLSARNLICELTETSLINNFESATLLCRELMELGAGIALDDFGTGYTSFNYLRRLPISQIKIDKTFVQNLPDNKYNQIIIQCLFDLSQNIGLELCVEGVETQNTLDILSEMGVRLIQGFYFERPMEADIIRREFKQHYGR
ncbi:MAG: EAL domain-containing protein [Eubacteriales bacterium]|nr:EAL domain-containing protein [Eubacteriales bacterium]